MEHETEKTKMGDSLDRVILVFVFPFSNSYLLKPNDCNKENDVQTLFLGFCFILVIFIWINF